MLRPRYNFASRNVPRPGIVPENRAAAFRPTMSTSEHTPAATARMVAAITARVLWQLAVMRTLDCAPASRK